MDTQIIDTLEYAFDRIDTFSPGKVDAQTHDAIRAVMDGLNEGVVRVASKEQGEWEVNEWVKKAILLYFRTHENKAIHGGFTEFYDKIPLKYAGYSEFNLKKTGVRIVPDAIVRYGAHVGANTVLMPSYVNIGAYIDTGCMIDTWATVGSCAQIGKNVHLSGGAGIGGVLEPLQASPTIIEDNCFIGARSEVVEGVVVGEGSVLSMGVFISSSTKIYNRETGEISYGRVPPGSVVVPGTLPAKDGTHSLSCAVIVKQVDAKTRAKTSINDLLRDA